MGRVFVKAWTTPLVMWSPIRLLAAPGGDESQHRKNDSGRPLHLATTTRLFDIFTQPFGLFPRVAVVPNVYYSYYMLQVSAR